MRRGAVVGAALVLVAGGAGVMSDGGGGVAVAASPGVLDFDFDGDGYADLALGVSGEDLAGVTDAGAVQVLYGSASGPTDRDQLWHQGLPGIQDVPEEGDRFGQDLASGDFDGDGFADLAVGVWAEDIGTTQDAGAVQVLYGGPSGLTGRNQLWHQDSPGVPGANESQDWFGSELAAGDFDGDGHADLAIGVSGEDLAGVDNAGMVVVLRGSASGLTSAGAVRFRQGADGVSGRAKGWFGGAMAAGDVTGDGRDDLVVGVSANLGYGERSPAIYLLKGSSAGLTGSGSQFIDGERRLGLGYGGGGGAALGDLTLADFNGDAHADLAVTAQEGFVAVLHGHGDGFRPARLRAPGVPGRDAVWSIPGWAEDEDGELASGDVTGDGHVDLIAQVDDPVMVFPGSTQGLSGSIIQWPVPSYADLAVLPLSGGTHAWLVAPVDGPGLPFGAGAVMVLRGTPDGAPGPATIWSQDSPGIEDSAEESDYFGWWR